MIDEAMFTLLKSSAGVATIVSEGSSFRIYPLVIPQHEEGDTTYMPCLVYTRIGATRGVTKGGTDTLASTTYQIDAYATTYKEAVQLADAVRGSILDFNGTVSGHYIRTINIDNEFPVEDPDPGLYRMTQTYMVWHTD